MGRRSWVAAIRHSLAPKKERPAGEMPTAQTDSSLLPDVLSGVRLVGSGRAADVQQVFDAADARHFQDRLLNGRDLIRVVHLAPNRDDAGLDIEIDPPLRQIAIAQDLAFHTVAQGQIIDRGRPGSQGHHPLGEGGGSGAGPPAPLVHYAPPTPQPRGAPVDEPGASRATAFRIEEIDRDRTADRAGDDGQRRWPTARGQPRARRLRLLTDLAADRLLGGPGELSGGIAGSAAEFLGCPADPVRDVAPHLLEINFLEVRHPRHPLGRFVLGCAFIWYLPRVLFATSFAQSKRISKVDS